MAQLKKSGAITAWKHKNNHSGIRYMEKPENYISCCGFYCKTCKEFTAGLCKGCKIGYDKGVRDISKAKCKIKICCFKEKNLTSCAECKEFPDCTIISNRFKVGTYQNRKCLEALHFIKDNGTSNYIKSANSWKSHYGRLKNI